MLKQLEIIIHQDLENLSKFMLMLLEFINQQKFKITYLKKLVLFIRYDYLPSVRPNPEKLLDCRHPRACFALGAPGSSGVKTRTGCSLSLLHLSLLKCLFLHLPPLLHHLDCD